MDLLINGVDFTHFRLVDLTRLADQAEPFYSWIESQFQSILSSDESLNYLLKTASVEQLKEAIRACYQPPSSDAIPFLFDGIGRTYSHSKACYYFFSWLIRDAPQQRLNPLIQRVVKASKRGRTEVEIEVLSTLIVKYRSYVKTFTWDAIREIVIDRLEGSRRSIKGHEKEAIIRTALLIAFQNYFKIHETYGIYAGVEIPDVQVVVGNESYDVSANLLDEKGQRISRILMPIKTRETEGGGHSHLFSRDILSAINAVRFDSDNDFLIVVIIARNWSSREAENLSQIVDHLIVLNLSPAELSIFDKGQQQGLNDFIALVLEGNVFPKSRKGSFGT